MFTIILIREAMKLSADINPIEVKRGIDKAKNIIIDYLEEISIKLDDLKTMKNVAAVASNYDDNIAEIVSEALWKTGTQGSIHIEPGTGFQSSLSVSL